MSKNRNLLCLLSLALMVFVIGGCGQKGPSRYEVTGEVTIRGKPVDGGFIEFWPQDGQGSMDAAQITSGSYQIVKSKGLFAGKYKVDIIPGSGSSGGEGAASPDYKDPQAGKRRPQITAKYNNEVHVKPEGPNKFDFHLK